MKNIVIGIEGEVASGKTSICRELLNLIDNSIFIDGGAIYRGIILAILKSNIDITKLKENVSSLNALDLMKKLNVEFKIENKETVIYIDGKRIDNAEIQNAQNAMGVTKMASKANNESLFVFARNIIDEYRKTYNIIVSARDLVDIYPDMSAHVYITADLDERVKRRYHQYKEKYSEDEIRRMITERDQIHEKAGFNSKCERSITVDVTECKSAKESAEKVLKNVNKLI
jgi:cytidylate kinase